MTTPHPLAGPTLGGWLQEQIYADQREAAAAHADDCAAWTIARQQDDAQKLLGPAWCTCPAKQALREASSKAHILGAARPMHLFEDETASRWGWQIMLHLSIPYVDRPGRSTVLPQGRFTRWRR
ncbi:hypothetical protein [Micromonospora sp. NPDC047730]|uniref:hypothetical protein n=1 Tax=Micromonospora sp. NPDC047730 TaxID=3364253 RepID=UPI0037181D94